MTEYSRCNTGVSWCKLNSRNSYRVIDIQKKLTQQRISNLRFIFTDRMSVVRFSVDNEAIDLKRVDLL